ncbi:membrane protein [soil metagenome]
MEFQNKPIPEKIATTGWVLSVIGILIIGASFIFDKERAAFDYLWLYMFLVSIGLGGLLLIAMEYVAGATWSIPFRRICEWLSGIIPLLIIMVIPLVFSMHSLFEWTHADVVSHDEVLKGKAAYLNVNFFLIRTAFCLLLWMMFSFAFNKNSRKQDDTKDPIYTKRNNRLGVIFAPLFFITITMFGIDWMMSLEPHWYSTIYGVYYFAGTIVAALAIVTFISIQLYEKGYFPARMGNQHFYSLGTLMFGFNIFWAYIGFSQFILQWYADIPEETFWYMQRWTGSWKFVSLLLLLVHFIIPFLVLLPRSYKTNLKLLKVMSIWMLFAHALDLYWLIMPTYSKTGAFFSWYELGFFFAAAGIIMVVFKMRSKNQNLIPIGDPKLEAGLDFHL